MNLHLIGYDLCRPGQEYSALIQAIKTFHDWVRICESTWVVTSDDTDIEICNNLGRYIDQNDRLFSLTLDPHKLACKNMSDDLEHYLRM